MAAIASRVDRLLRLSGLAGPVARLQYWGAVSTLNVKTITELSGRVVGDLTRRDVARALLTAPAAEVIDDLPGLRFGAFAIIQELRKPSDERAWRGKVADFVPYDFRMPTIERVRSTYWNPEGPILPGKVFGVGWALNLGALTRMAGDRGSRGDSKPQPS